jgi:hypothetical protein
LKLSDQTIVSITAYHSVKNWMLLGSSLIYQSVELTTLSKIYYCVAVCVTLLAGILLLALFSLETRINWTSIFFLVSGFFQIFWVVPVVKRWGNYWYYAGIAGALISIAVYVDYPIFLVGILIEVLQATFIVLCGVIPWENRSILWKNRGLRDKNIKAM